MSSPQNNLAEGYENGLSCLEVRLDRIVRNYLSLQKRLKRGADCAAVVKADSYGLGTTEIVPELYKANCRHFYVANIAGGLTVRTALVGQEAQVYILNGPYGAAPEELAWHKLTPVLNTPGDVEYWSDFASRSGQRLSAVIQLDTGMNRLGFAAVEMLWLEKNAARLKALDVRYVMSHLACADEPSHPKNREQLERFKKMTQQLGLPCRFSLSNSSGIFLGEDYHFDQVRPGCALYGINPQPGQENPMQGVVVWKTRILQIRNAEPGETVGYGADYRLASRVKLATISVGYADGLLRSFSGTGAVYINGQKCPVVGRISMELIVADITHVTPAPHERGWAEIIGDHQTVDDVAAAENTIGYEVLINLGRSHKRVYSGQG